MTWNNDMDAAPKDGQRLLLWVPPYGPITGHFDLGPTCEYGVWRCHSILNKEAQPTHWMFLPPPPKDTSHD